MAPVPGVPSGSLPLAFIWPLSFHNKRFPWCLIPVGASGLALSPLEEDETSTFTELFRFREVPSDFIF